MGADGQYLPGSFFAHLLKDYDHAIRHYQVVQEKPGEIILKIVKAGRYSDQALTEVLAILAALPRRADADPGRVYRFHSHGADREAAGRGV